AVARRAHRAPARLGRGCDGSSKVARSPGHLPRLLARGSARARYPWAMTTSNNENLRSGIDHEALDAQVRPQDDLFRHVNGKWRRETEIPSDKASYGSFHILHD